MAVLPDYWLVARVGSWLHRRHLDFGKFTVEQLASCRRVGDGQVVRGPDLQLAMDCAFWFWLAFSMLELPLALALIPVLIGLLPSRAGAAGFACLLGVWAFAVSSWTFALIRSANHQDVERVRPGSRLQSFVASKSRPRPRDPVVSLTAAALAILVVILTIN